MWKQPQCGNFSFYLYTGFRITEFRELDFFCSQQSMTEFDLESESQQNIYYYQI